MKWFLFSICMFNGYDSMLMCKSGRPDDDGFQQSKFKIKNLDEMETLYMLKQASVVWKGQKWDRAYWPIRTPFTKKLGESEIYFKKSVHKKKLAHWILQVMVNNTQIFTRLDFSEVWSMPIWWWVLSEDIWYIENSSNTSTKIFQNRSIF